MTVERPPVPHGPYVVAGLGRAGCAAVDALLAFVPAARIVAWDGASGGRVRSVARGLRRRGVEVQLGGGGVSALEAAGPGATVIWSPGLEPDLPLLRCAKDRGLDVLAELELGWRLTRGPIVGVTGTNGKSTTCQLICMALAAGGRGARLAGNTDFGVPLSAAAGSAADRDDWIVCEVSTFQLESCTSFLPDLAILTNLTLEHLARHGNMGCYGALKRSMFLRGERHALSAVVNLDDPFGRRLAGELSRAGVGVLGYGFDADADVRVERAEWDMREARTSLSTPEGPVELATRLPGRYNASNVAAALAASHALGLSVARTAEALQGAGPPPGRWEVMTEHEHFDVIVDFAHNPDGVRQLLEAARTVIDTRPGAVLRTVLGPTGKHHGEKARQLGALVGALSDHLVLTTGTGTYGPRVVRLDELRRAARGAGLLEVVLDRRAAIEHAIAAARPGDVIAVLGVGALPELVLDAAGTLLPFDDREAVRQSLARARDRAPAGALR